MDQGILYLKIHLIEFIGSRIYLNGRTQLRPFHGKYGKFRWESVGNLISCGSFVVSFVVVQPKCSYPDQILPYICSSK